MTTTATIITKDSDALFTIGGESEYLNPDLGIRNVKLFKPSAKQQGMGIVTTMLVDSGIGRHRKEIFVPRPLDLEEEHLIALLKAGIEEGVLSVKYETKL
ncbi:hypothetical protein AB9M93_26165 [Peribacillus frigoritolerans]|uniref:hypothetical protein n=1 Tax=Peribacillus frigoritolerans TaxID=450367 RepID=UPI003514BFE3